MNPRREARSNTKFLLFCGVLLVLFVPLQLLAKIAVDFDPNLDFSKYKPSPFSVASRIS